MCIVFLALGVIESIPIVIATNRDENLERTSIPSAAWPHAPQVIGGLDLQDVPCHSFPGTWLGINYERRKIALLTNHRESAVESSFSGSACGEHATFSSRGILVRDFLLSDKTAQEYVQHISEHHSRCFAGYHLCVIENVGKDNPVCLLVSHPPFSPVLTRQLSTPGIYVWSNGDAIATADETFLQSTPHSPWVKVEKGIKLFQEILKISKTQKSHEMIRYLKNALKALLFTRNANEQTEHWLKTSIFIDPPIVKNNVSYATRTSSIILVINRSIGESAETLLSFDEWDRQSINCSFTHRNHEYSL